MPLARVTVSKPLVRNLDTRIGRFEELLLGRAETVTREIETRSQSAAELLTSRMEQLSLAIRTSETYSADVPKYTGRPSIGFSAKL